MKFSLANTCHSRLKLSVLALLGISLVGCSAGNPYYQADKPHHTPTGFQNLNTQLVPKTWLDVLQWRLTSSPAPAAPANSVPQIAPDLALIHHPAQPQATWLGHSTLLVQAGGLNILTDPIFSERASPGSFVMADEAINQPPKDLEKALADNNIDPQFFRSLAIGETFRLPRVMP